jgi:DNA-directed RNA polymerase I, II, and III subunit RPABC5
MIIPIKCFTCGNVLADKYRYFLELVRKEKITDNEYMETDNVVYFTNENMSKTIQGEIMDKLQLTNVCCRRHILTHVDIE